MNALVFRPLASIAWILPGGSLVELARRSMGFGVAILAVSVVVAQALATFDPGPTAPSHAARPIAQPDLAAVVRPIRVTLGDDSLVLDEARLAAVATVARARVVIDADALDDLVAAIAAELDVPARDAVLRASGGGLALG